VANPGIFDVKTLLIVVSSINGNPLKMGVFAVYGDYLHFIGILRIG